jgi:hypothetical protein
MKPLRHTWLRASQGERLPSGAAMPFMRQRLSGASLYQTDLLFRVQLEVDIHLVVGAAAKALWQGINLRHPFRNRSDRFIHHDIAGRSRDREVRDAMATLVVG